ncbi:aminoacyl-tRNA hydrolase [Candidatus Uhrbacteria bacterium]|nr:aminoacyl-tRNA hydrolase [Candidatus Uhrbacteria bacterium]
MKLIVGLGNPGKEYAKTRHNAGIRAVRAFHTLQADVFDGWKEKFSAEISAGVVGGEKVALMFPQTFMNSSGDAVIQAAQFWKIAPADIVVVYDDFDLPLGSIRILPKGGPGGHNGIDSVLTRLGTKDVPRVRIGVRGPGTEKIITEKYVLERFSDEEEKILAEALKKAAEAIGLILKEGIEAAMNKCN